MAHGGLRRGPYEAVVGLLSWAHGNWLFVNGKALLNGCRLAELDAPDFISVLVQLHVEDQMHEKEMRDHLEQVRGDIASRFYGNGYNGTESYGMTNDSLGGAESSEEPLPYIEPTQQTEDGYLGLDPPLA